MEEEKKRVADGEIEEQKRGSHSLRACVCLSACDGEKESKRERELVEVEISGSI